MDKIEIIKDWLKPYLEEDKVKNEHDEGFFHCAMLLNDFIDTLSDKPDKNLDEAAKEYRNFRKKCGIKDPVMLNEIEEAYYVGAEWMAEQGVSMEVVRGVPWRAVDAFIHDHDYSEDSIIQIRKK